MSDDINKITKDYLTADELAKVFRLKNHKTILNWVYYGEFEKGVEYVKIRGVLLFYWPAIRSRLHAKNVITRKKPIRNQTASKGRCLINL